MSYYFGKSVKGTFEEVVAKTIDALKIDRFDVISDLDIETMLHDKIGQGSHTYCGEAMMPVG